MGQSSQDSYRETIKVFSPNQTKDGDRRCQGYSPEYVNWKQPEGTASWRTQSEKNVLPSAEDVKSEKNHQNILTGIEAFKSDNLKHTETQEKIILPGAEEIQTEKNIQGLLQGVTGFENEKLKNVKTREPASPSSILQTELARDSSLTAVSDFDKNKLKKAETAEKNPLPSNEAIAQEMEHIK